MTKKIENPFNYGTDPELNRIFDSLLSLQTRVAQQFAKAEKIAGLGQISAFVPLSDVKIDLPNYRYERTKGHFAKTPLAQVENIVRPAVEIAKAKIAEAEVANKPLEEQNSQLVAQVTELLTRIGVPSNYSTYEYPSSRSKTKKTVSHTAGYISDLARIRPKSNISNARYQLDTYVRDFESWLRTEVEEERAASLKKDNDVVQSRIFQNPALVEYLMKADVNVLDELNKAVPGRKSEVIEYCRAMAINNLKSKPEPDWQLIDLIMES